MNTALFWSIFGNLIGLVFCAGYAAYTFVRQGVHVRGQGWKTKQEAPKSFYFTIGILVLISIFSLGSIIFRLYTYYNA